MKSKPAGETGGCSLGPWRTLPLSWIAACLVLGAAGRMDGAEPFPETPPEYVGVSSAALARVSDRIRSWCERDALVGAEILIVKGRKTVLHRAFGWRDRERRQPFERNTICQIRSMTKPFVATSIFMLADAGKLHIDDRISKHVRFFADRRLEEITIRQLLTHTGGLGDYPGRPSDFDSLEALVRAIAARGPAHPVGRKYHYSNAGAATLAHLVAVVSGMPVERFIEKRITRPLEMEDTFCNLVSDSRRARVSCTYRKEGGRKEGGRKDGGRFVRTWDSSTPQEVPYFRGAGGIYSTTADYARFLAMWMDGGRNGPQRLLTPETVPLALTPTFHHPRYAHFWYVTPQRRRGDPVALPEFGHGGADGTRAWAIPASNAMFVFFSQCDGPLPAQVQGLVKEALATPEAW